MGDALGDESVIDMTMQLMHSSRALSEGVLTIVGNADGSTHAMWGKLGRWIESSIEARRWASVSISAVKSAAARLLFRMRLTLNSELWNVITSDYQKSKELQRKLSSFIEEHIIPIEDEFIAFQSDKNNMWKRFPKTEMLKKKAKDAGLWNLFLPKDYVKK